MHVAARARLVLARHPWLYWTAVAALAALLAAIVHAQTAQLDDARRAWGRTLPVLVATGPLKPGDTIEAHTVDVPVALVPTDALQALPDGARLRQRVAGGEILTDVDVADLVGPAALADDETVVVALSDPLSRNLTIGLDVQVAADGLVLADSATVVDLVGEITFVAVAAAEGPAVAAAAQQGLASLLYLP